MASLRSGVAVEQALAAAFAKFGIEPDFTSPLAAWALDRIEKLADGSPGPWHYRPAGGNSRKHPLQKVKAKIERLQCALRDCQREAKAHMNVAETNACADFFEQFKIVSGMDAFYLVRLLESPSKFALECGVPRKGNAPIKLRSNELIIDIFFLFRAHIDQIDWHDWHEIFVGIAFEAQNILPESDRENRVELKARLATIRRQREMIFRSYGV